MNAKADVKRLKSAIGGNSADAEQKADAEAISEARTEVRDNGGFLHRHQGCRWRQGD